MKDRDVRKSGASLADMKIAEQGVFRTERWDDIPAIDWTHRRERQVSGRRLGL